MGSEGGIVEIVGGFVDLSRNRLVRGGAWERIPPKEVELLRHLAGRPGVDVAAEDLFREVWRIDSSTYRATLQTTVHRLRKKIEADPHAPRIVVNGSGGYRYVPLPAVERAPLPGEDVVPDPPSSFVGRREELGAVHAALLRGARAVVFKGAAGIGKTRLAARYARSGDARAWGAGAVVYVEVAEARTSVALAQALARALGLDLRVGPGGLDWAARAGRALAARGSVLVVLDGLESALPHGARLLGRWAADAPESRFLVTTRILPHLEGAEVVELAPLSGGDGAALYADRAGGTAGDPDLVALLERLGGNPLGIELVASWADVFTPRTLLRRLSALDLQRRGGGRRGNRHDSLREAIAGSWALLRPEPQRVLAACSVFRGGFTVEGLTAVGAAGGAQADATARALETLVEHSLVRIRPRPDGGAERFVLDEPVRAFAAERLAASGREGEVRARRAEWAARFGEERAAAAELGTDPRALRDLAEERRNLAAALEECADPDVSLRLALVLDTVAGLLGPPEGRVERLDRALARGGEPAPGLLGRVHYARAVAIRDRGRARASHADFGAAMERARQAGDEALAARALAGLGNAHGLVGELATAEELLTRAREVAEPLDRGPLLAGILGDLGTVKRRRGDAQSAEELYRAALVAARRGGDRRGEGRVLGMLALLRNRQGRWEEAAEHHRRELEIAGEIGDRRWRGTALSNLGRVEAESGRLPEAETALREALALHREVGNAAHEAITRCNLGMARLEVGDIAEADELVGDALALHVELGDRFHEAVARIDLGWIRLWQGRRADAEACADLAREVATSIADRALQGYALLFRGAVAARALEVEAAAASVDEAAALMGGGVPVDLGRAAARAAGARLAGDRGPDDARRGRREALDLLPRWDDGGAPGGSDARLWIRLVREILAPLEPEDGPGAPA
ncbi:tetratricopeptide repeat protein [Myxococcota bacterium]|nr:tetratricopeptide repeat protein [Myxococcota bacterium]